MLRLSLIACAVCALLAAPAGVAARTTLLPGVALDEAVQFTPHGPVALHVVTGPRPVGLYALKPVLSNETIIGRETVTSIQKRLAQTATMVGVNGDLFTLATGRPSGILMRDRVVENPPFGARSSVGVSDDGTLDVRRVSFFGTWRGIGQRRTLNDLNEVPGPNGIALFTSAYGPVTPRQAGVAEAVIAPLPPTTPNTDLTGPVVQVLRGGGGTAIPAGGAVLVARGTAGQRLAEEAPVGVEATVRLIFKPDWSTIANAVGGGPVIVRNGGPVFRANEAFIDGQLVPRNPRTAVGQLADGRILLVVTDGRQPGYSAGMTNFELAQTMARLGAVSASAFDAGGSSTLAFDGQLLNRPSDPGGERQISTALMLMYYGVVATPPAERVVSPNGDGVAETQQLSYKIVRPSSVTVRLTAPDGSVAWMETADRTPGTYGVAFPPPPPPPLPPPSTEPVPPPAPPVVPPPPAVKGMHQPAIRPRLGEAYQEGRWRLDVSSVDDQGQSSADRQPFTVNNTLGYLTTRSAYRRFVVRPGGNQVLRIGTLLTRAARVTVTIESKAGVRVRTLTSRARLVGKLAIVWNGRTIGGKAWAYSGTYLVRVSAKNALGTVELKKNVSVLRAAPVKKPKHKQQRG